MRSLSELQGAFALALENPQEAGAAAEIFRGAPKRTVARLAVYRGNLYANAGKALAAAYPIVRKIVGHDFFDEMARNYVRAHPSRRGDLNCYGERLPEFVRDFAHTADLPYLSDVARMEWLAHRAYFAKDASALDASSFASLAPQRLQELRVQFSAACALLESVWPLGRIWAIHQDDYQGVFEIDLHAGPDRILVYRRGWRARVRALAPGEFFFLASALRGDTLGAALEAGARADAGFHPSATLARCIDDQVLTSLV